MGWHRELTLESVAANRDALHDAIAEHRSLALMAFACIYAGGAGLPLPGCTVITLTGGLLFGWLLVLPRRWWAPLPGQRSCSSSLAPRLARCWPRKAGPVLGKVQGGFQRNALSYLVFLRLVPAFPFWAVNLAPAVLGMPLRTYLSGHSSALSRASSSSPRSALALTP